MSEPFLITGLPRSRTAWFAAVASNDRSICYHEPLSRLDRWEDIFSVVWCHQQAEYVGISDHGLGFWLAEIMDRLAPRTLIIERPMEEVKASLTRIGVTQTNMCELLLEKLAVVHPRVMRVPYAALESVETVTRCLRHLMPTVNVNASRIRELQRLNIQADVKTTLADAQSRVRAVDHFVPRDVLARLEVA